MTAPQGISQQEWSGWLQRACRPPGLAGPGPRWRCSGLVGSSGQGRASMARWAPLTRTNAPMTLQPVPFQPLVAPGSELHTRSWQGPPRRLAPNISAMSSGTGGSPAARAVLCIGAGEAPIRPFLEHGRGPANGKFYFILSAQDDVLLSTFFVDECLSPRHNASTRSWLRRNGLACLETDSALSLDSRSTNFHLP